MNEEALYKYSKDFDLFVRKIKACMHFQYYRYAKFVDNSPIGNGGYPDGLDCVYARHTKAQGAEETEHLKRFLEHVICDAQSLIDRLDEK